MDDAILKELFEKQGMAIAMLSLRIATLEQVLLEKGYVTEKELEKKSVQLGTEFFEKTQKAIKKAAEEGLSGS